jgi:serine protease Do
MTVTDFFGQVGRVPSAGSGFIITDDGYIVTNNHVVRGAVSITVVLDQGDAYEARLVGTDQNNDIAVLKIEADHLPTVFLGDSADVQVGELAVAIGNPLGELSNTVTAGVISGLDREITIDGQTLRLLQTDAAINSGNSAERCSTHLAK